ncbi:DEAD/DEAH box helicase family protein [Burkholderiaceae bacterium DAT-1]|nr:DEAD/DEAH box helicase family protein [Burkholderiaceae bacterium DAT-1]
MQLRRWQSECVALALETYKIRRDFLCLATPGSGKSRMSAVLAKKLLDQGEIDFILCFAPSLAVVEGLQATFTEVLGRRFDGLIGSSGGAYTYQSMLNFGPEFWQIFRQFRVLAVFDEIHHCSGSQLELANAWGQEILSHIQSRAQFTLALTGTPWRSDRTPITLARYSDTEGNIRCDYIYGLKDAIRDAVCRVPKIVLIDNTHISVKSPDEPEHTYASFAELLQEKGHSYQMVIRNRDAIRYMLESAILKLQAIRTHHKNAGGLIVAASVRHATLIMNMLMSDFGQTACLVSYQNADSRRTINEFRRSSTQWIVSIGMVCEGTDIPRLQVCCHLSPIKTELHYRQVLGRILRNTRICTGEGWLYTFAEPTLVEMANQIAVDIPGQCIVQKVSLTYPTERKQVLNLNPDIENVALSGFLEYTSAQKDFQSGGVKRPLSDKYYISMSSQFREQILALFTSPFQT